MASPELIERLSRIQTRWTMIFQAHRGQGHEVLSAQHRLLLRYYRPVFRYLRATVGDANAAEELTHEFVVRFLRGDFKRADPSRGRFRDLLKRALRHLAIDHWRRKRLEKEKSALHAQTASQQPPAEADWRCNPPVGLADVEPDRTFLRTWRTEMLTQAWQALARFQEQARNGYHTVLRARADHPKAGSAELARRVATRLGKPLSEAAFRQLLRRAREKFADFLVAEVARSLATSDLDAIEAEIVELDLLPYCRRSLVRLRTRWAQKKAPLRGRGGPLDGGRGLGSLRDRAAGPGG